MVRGNDKNVSGLEKAAIQPSNPYGGEGWGEGELSDEERRYQHELQDAIGESSNYEKVEEDGEVVGYDRTGGFSGAQMDQEGETRLGRHTFTGAPAEKRRQFMNRNNDRTGLWDSGSKAVNSKIEAGKEMANKATGLWNKAKENAKAVPLESSLPQEHPVTYVGGGKSPAKKPQEQQEKSPTGAAARSLWNDFNSGLNYTGNTIAQNWGDLTNDNMSWLDAGKSILNRNMGGLTNYAKAMGGPQGRAADTMRKNVKDLTDSDQGWIESGGNILGRNSNYMLDTLGMDETGDLMNQNFQDATNSDLGWLEAGKRIGGRNIGYAADTVGSGLSSAASGIGNAWNWATGG